MRVALGELSNEAADPQETAPEAIVDPSHTTEARQEEEPPQTCSLTPKCEGGVDEVDTTTAGSGRRRFCERKLAEAKPASENPKTTEAAVQNGGEDETPKEDSRPNVVDGIGDAGERSKVGERVLRCTKHAWQKEGELLATCLSRS